MYCLVLQRGCHTLSPLSTLYAGPCGRVVSSVTSRHRYLYQQHHNYFATCTPTAQRPWLLSVVASSAFHSASLLGDYRSSDAPVHQQNVLTIITKQGFDEVVLAGGHNVFLVVVNDQERDYQLASCVLRRWIQALAEVVAHPVLRFVLFDGARCSVPSPLAPEPEIYIFPVNKNPSQFIGPLTFPTPLLTFLQELIPSLRLDIATLSAHPVLKAAASFSQLVKDYMDVGTRISDIIHLVEKVTTTEEDSRLQRLTDDVQHCVTALIRANVSGTAVDSSHMRQVEQGVQHSIEKMRKEVASWRDLLTQVNLSRAVSTIVQMTMEGATESLSEQEISRLHVAIQQLTTVLNLFAKQKPLNLLSVRLFDENWQARERGKAVERAEAPAAATVDRRAEQEQGPSLFSQPAPASPTIPAIESAENISTESVRTRLAAACGAVASIFASVRVKLDAKQAQLAAQSDGCVHQCASSAALTDAVAEASRIDQLAVIAFTAVWCPLSGQLRAVFGSVSRQYPNIVFVRADVHDCEEAAEMWKVSTTPTVVVVGGPADGPVCQLHGAEVMDLPSRLEQLLRVNR